MTRRVAASVAVLPYDPEWRRRGQELIAELRSGLGPAALHVDHIGSTAIPGMAAKPVLDVQVRVADLDAAAAAFDDPLAARGFLRRPFDRDHVPAGVPEGDGRGWHKRYWSRTGAGLEPVHLHVRVAGAPNARLALLFRDWLRAHPAAVAAYSEFKSRLADATADAAVYTDVKDPVVDLVIVAAEAWATDTGWMPPAA
jgi:GrpB-like predicted nucleotidyltransferase (UPF0157 family)